MAPLVPTLLPMLLTSIASEDGVSAEYDDDDEPGVGGGEDSDEDEGDVRAITVRTAWLDEKAAAGGCVCECVGGWVCGWVYMCVCEYVNCVVGGEGSCGCVGAWVRWCVCCCVCVCVCMSVFADCMVG